MALVQALGFVVVLAVLPAFLASAAAHIGSMIEQTLSGAAAEFSPTVLIVQVLSLSLPLLFASALTAFLGGIAQTGGAVTFKKLSPDLNRANPITGLKNLVRPERFVAILRALVGTLLVTWLAWRLTVGELASLANAVGRLEPATRAGLTLADTLAWVAALVGLGVGLVDVLASRYSWLRRLRMNKDEIKREHRQAEGDPELKSARQRAHREALAGASLNAVRDATVVIINPTHIAVALRYDENDDGAPKVVSQGAGELARKIIDAARAYGVPVVRDVPVARALSELEVGDEIPEELYEAVAEVLHEVLEQGETSGD